MRYSVMNDRPEPYQADALATLKIESRGAHAEYEVLLNGNPLGMIPAADKQSASTSHFDVPGDQLTKVVRVTLRATGSGSHVGPVWLEYKKKKISDLRYPTFERYWLGKPASKTARVETELYFCLP